MKTDWGSKGEAWSQPDALMVTQAGVGGEWEKHDDGEMVGRDQSRHILKVAPTGIADGLG